MKNRDLILHDIRLSEVKAIHIHDPTKLLDSLSCEKCGCGGSKPGRSRPWSQLCRTNWDHNGHPPWCWVCWVRSPGGERMCHVYGHGRGGAWWGPTARLCQPPALHPRPSPRCCTPFLRSAGLPCFSRPEWQQHVYFLCVVRSEHAVRVSRVLTIPQVLDG